MPGCEASIGRGVSTMVRRYPEPAQAMWFDEPADLLVERLRERLLGAAEWAAEGARQVAVLVGGVDSSGVVGAMAQVVPRERLRVLTVAGGEGEIDGDLPYVQSMCRHLGVRLHHFVWSPTKVPLEDGLIVDGRPAYAPYFTQAWVKELADAGVDRLVSASGGDSVFGGTMNELGHRLAHAPVQTLRAGFGAYPWAPRLRSRLHWLFAEHAAPVLRRRRDKLPRVLRPAAARQGWQASPLTQRGRTGKNAWRPDPFLSGTPRRTWSRLSCVSRR